ncbi:hypothetical protein [Bradyrhizobium commune]|uniref:Uncharacterized protein n=1 Tax=Bradyrhizobium commune TaxID=83627 RepID=A0A7S9D9R0_9BRAD|nr:hypothetical protein [Bradyrhizobium commune]QPF93755.1 hypothetical protein IC761_11025 [Bradyrhizobium commune]
MKDIRIPLPGDVLFFESAKIHGKAIALEQRRLGLEHYKYIHAALVVEGDLVLESTTRQGVDKVRLSSLDDPSQYLNAAVLRNATVSSLTPFEETGELAKAAYYFYKEAYDWPGIVDRDLDRDGKSICSVFVKKALLRAEQVPTTAFAKYRTQIFPAELFGALLDAGYQILDQGYDRELMGRASFRLDDIESSLDIIDILEQSREHNRLFEELDKVSRRSRRSVDELLERLGRESSRLWRYISFFRAAKLTFIDFIHLRFETILRDFEGLDRKVKKEPQTWRDRSEDNAAALHHSDAIVRFCKGTMNVVAAFIEMVPSKSIVDRISQSPPVTTSEGVTELLMCISLIMLEVFLVTGARDLDQLDAKVRESRAKLNGYKEAVDALPAVRGFKYPSLADVYETPIAILEQFADMFRSHESAFGKPVMDQIVVGSRKTAEELIAELAQLTAPAEPAR